MSDTDWKKRISVDPTICHGRPCIRGTRIWVSLVLDLLGDGSSIDEVIAEYPQLTVEDVRACISYGAAATRERFIPVAMDG